VNWLVKRYGNFYVKLSDVRDLYEEKEFKNKKNRILVLLVIFHVLDVCSQALLGCCDCKLLHLSARYCSSITLCDS